MTTKKLDEMSSKFFDFDGKGKAEVLPSRADFIDEIGKAAVQSGATAMAVPPLYLQIPYTQPHLLYPAFSGRGGILFESANLTQKKEINSFIVFEPYAFLRAKDGQVEMECGGKRALSAKKDPLSRLKDSVHAYRQKANPGLPPFQGGAAGLICYDYARHLENIPPKKDDLLLPDICFVMADRLLAFDHALKKAWLVFCPGARQSGLGYGDISGLDWAGVYDDSVREMARIFKKLQKEIEKISPDATHGAAPRGGREAAVSHEMTEEEYVSIVARAKEYIAAGDIFQANLSLRLSAGLGGAAPWEIYLSLRDINPSPFAAFMEFGDFFVAGSSPERLIKLKDGLVETRPIAGTRPRGKDGGEDCALRAELLLNEKEKAEHIMLVDLERNDIGKVAEWGSVEVDELMTTEDYSHVMHIVSNVKGRLAAGKDMFDCLRAAFPGGTITGVPKVRCMEIINELEPVRRGAYTGSAGYFGFSGAMDMNIMIRTFLIKNDTAYMQAGAGIVADSNPEREYRESLKKAEALLLALKTSMER